MVPNKEVDLLIIGGGPAGLTAAIYAVRGNLEVVLLESEVVGGQVASSYTIENYPGNDNKTFRNKQLTLNNIGHKTQKSLSNMHSLFQKEKEITKHT